MAESNATASVSGNGRKRGTREEIVEAAPPERIILSRSAASGQMRADSDFELSSSGMESTTGPSRGRSTCASQPRAETRAVDLVVATTEDIERHRGTPYDVIERHRTKVACCMAAPARGTDPATAENQ